jgi:hypothetical protein
MSEWLKSPASTPPDTTLFAVGDIHGRLDLLCALQRLILERANESDTTTQCIVYLGDYIDKGPDSLGVLHHLSHRLGNERIQERYLLGNHDQYLLQTLQQGDPAVLATWFDYGGRATLERLGVPLASSSCQRSSAVSASAARSAGFRCGWLPGKARTFLPAWRLLVRSCWFESQQASDRTGFCRFPPDPRTLFVLARPLAAPLLRGAWPYAGTAYATPASYWDRYGRVLYGRPDRHSIARTKSPVFNRFRSHRYRR